MEVEQFSILLEGGAFELGRRAAFEPQPSGFDHHDAGAVGRMDAGFHIDRDMGVIGVGVLLAGEGLEVPRPMLIDVIGDPSLLGFAAARDPASFTNRHD